MKRVSVRLTPEADEACEYLVRKASDSKQEETILNAFHQKIELIKNDVHYGNPIAKRLIPSEYKNKYGVKNLFRVELPRFWRMLYTLTAGNPGVETLVIVIDIIDHKKNTIKYLVTRSKFFLHFSFPRSAGPFRFLF